MIVHQAERTAATDVHTPAHHPADVLHHPTAESSPGRPASHATVDRHAGAVTAPHVSGGPTGSTIPDPTSLGQVLGRALGTGTRLGFSAIMDDERRQLWPSFPGRTDPGLAARAAGRWPAPAVDSPRLGRQVLRADRSSPRVARDFTRATLAEWRLGHVSDEAVLTVSELVTNALCHGLDGTVLSAQHCPVQLVLLGHRRRLVTVVTDPAERIPVLAERGPAAESGRGLHVVDAVSSAWGWAPLATGGKAVWAAFDVTPATGARRPRDH